MDNKILIALFLTMSVCSAEMHLQGEISADLDATGNPFVIEKTIAIPAGKKVKIKEGVLLLFKEYAGMKVMGNLIIE